MRLFIFVAVLCLLCLSSCALSTAQKSPDSAQTTNIKNVNGNANLSLKPTPPIAANESKKTNSNQQPQCSKEFQTETVKYKDLPKEVKAGIDETAKNKYSEFSLLISSSIDDPKAKEPRCRTYYDYSTTKDVNGDEVPEKQNIGWRFVQVAEHWKYIPPAPSAKIANEPNRNQANQQPQCSKEFQTETVKYKDLPKEVKAEIDETAKNEYSKFIKLTYQAIEDPSAKEPRCETYIDFNTREYWDGNEVPEKQNVGWTFIRVGEHWKYIPPYTPKKKQRRR